MKIEFDGWTVEDHNTLVSVKTKYLWCIIGGGKLSTVGTPEQRAAYNHLEDKFGTTPGVTALTVAAELQKYLKEGPDSVVVGGYTVKRCQDGGSNVDILHAGTTYCLGLDLGTWSKDTTVITAVRAKWVPGRTVAEVAEDVKAALEGIVVHGYTVRPDCGVTAPTGAYYAPVRHKEPELKRYDPPLIWYLRENTPTTATQADVVAKIKEYFEGPRVVKGCVLDYWTPGGKRYVCVNGDRLIGHEWDGCGGYGTPVAPVIIAAKEKWAGKEPLLPEVAEFIENWKEPDPWHDSTLRCERDDRDVCVIPFAGRYIRLNLATGVSSVHKTAEEAKR